MELEVIGVLGGNFEFNVGSWSLGKIVLGVGGIVKLKWRELDN